MRKVCHFNHRYTSTMRDKMREKNTGNHKISIWSPINQQDFWLSQTCNFFFKELFSSPLSVWKPPVHSLKQSRSKLNHGQDQRAVQGHQEENCRPAPGWEEWIYNMQAAWCEKNQLWEQLRKWKTYCTRPLIITDKDILKNVSNQLMNPIDFHRYKNTMEVNGIHQLFGYQHSSTYLFLVFSRSKRSRFETTWGWVNDDRIFICMWTIPLTNFTRNTMLVIVLSRFTCQEHGSACLDYKPAWISLDQHGN